MKPKILLVDDEESIRYTFEAFLSEEGYSVISADSYNAALALMRVNHFDLMYVDIVLEGRSGIDLLKKGSGNRDERAGYHDYRYAQH